MAFRSPEVIVIDDVSSEEDSAGAGLSVTDDSLERTLLHQSVDENVNEACFMTSPGGLLFLDDAELYSFASQPVPDAVCGETRKPTRNSRGGDEEAGMKMSKRPKLSRSDSSSSTSSQHGVNEGSAMASSSYTSKPLQELPVRHRSRKSNQQKKSAAQTAKNYRKAGADDTKRLNGFYKYKEIELFVETSLANTEIGELIEETVQRDDTGGAQAKHGHLPFTVQSGAHIVPNSIWWVHKTPHARRVWPWTVLILSGQDFYQRMLIDKKDKNYHPGGLAHTITKVEDFQKSWRDAYHEERMANVSFGANELHKRPRFLLFVTDWSKTLLEKQLEQPRGKRKKKSGGIDSFSEAEIKQNINHLLVHRDCEVIFFNSDEAMANQIKSMTRYFAEKAYIKETHSLNVVPKANCPLDYSEEEHGDHKKAWCRMLMQVPGVGPAKAVALCRHYPTINSLYDKYNDLRLEEEDKLNLLANKMGGRVRHGALSGRIYRLMTSANPQLTVGPE